MKIAGALAFAGFFVLLAGAAAAQGKVSKKQEELKWAKGVATDFLAAVRSGEWKEAATLMTAEYRKSFGLAEVANRVYRVGNAGLAKGHTIGDEQIAPDRDEATFKGLLQGEKREALFRCGLSGRRPAAGGALPPSGTAAYATSPRPRTSSRVAAGTRPWAAGFRDTVARRGSREVGDLQDTFRTNGGR